MATKTILLEIDVEEGEDAAVKELLAYLAYTKKIRKYLWREKETTPFKQLPPPVANSSVADRDGSKEAAEPVDMISPPPSSYIMTKILEQLEEWKQESRLIRLKALKGQGKYLDVACKIVSYDPDSSIVAVYDVDRKVVETVRIIEIEDIDAAL